MIHMSGDLHVVLTGELDLLLPTGGAFLGARKLAHTKLIYCSRATVCIFRELGERLQNSRIPV